MTLEDMLTELRSVVDDDPGRPAWSDTALYGFLGEGQDKFCEDTGYFRDARSFTIELESGTSLYEVPDRIIEILSIWYGYKKLTKIPTGSDFDAADTDWSVTLGVPTHWRLDEDSGYVVLYPTPSAAVDGERLTLKVWRYSLNDLGTGEHEPELPSRLQRACIEWAAYKALSDHDAETQDPVKADDHLDNYKIYVRDGLAAFRRTHGIEASVGSNPAYRT